MNWKYFSTIQFAKFTQFLHDIWAPSFGNTDLDFIFHLLYSLFSLFIGFFLECLRFFYLNILFRFLLGICRQDFLLYHICFTWNILFTSLFFEFWLLFFYYLIFIEYLGPWLHYLLSNLLCLWFRNTNIVLVSNAVMLSPLHLMRNEFTYFIFYSISVCVLIISKNTGRISFEIRSILCHCSYLSI